MVFPFVCLFTCGFPWDVTVAKDRGGWGIIALWLTTISDNIMGILKIFI